MSKSRNWCFTVNNYTDENIAVLDALDVRYIIYGKEKGEQGTPHLQGYVSWKNSCTFSACKGKLPQGAHIEKAKGDGHDNREYCSKEGDFVERGKAPSRKAGGQAEKRRWRDAFHAAQEGRDEDIPEDIRMRYDKNIERIRNRYLFDNRDIEDTEQQMLWYYGRAGTGKSRKAREENPGAYLKACNKWWCGYTGEEVVIIDDFDKKHDVLCHHMKIWGDRYKFRAEIKGGSMLIRPRLVVVTSNYHPRDIWTSEQDVEPILRRYKCIEFKKLAESDNQS